LVALANIMRLSLRKGAHAVLSSAAWQKIRVRFGRDDKFVAGPRAEYSVPTVGGEWLNKCVISTWPLLDVRKRV
jgi:hypothetical protein